MKLKGLAIFTNIFNANTNSDRETMTLSLVGISFKMIQTEILIFNPITRYHSQIVKRGYMYVAGPIKKQPMK